ncbi:uncharacterized protein LOC127245296 isoform X2 [Andrographis paniculata]|uniref:uncharacterized protein LOC127245296 isoform X2 n=1 Tax=Andrographis paniculata TaxID=175694 RepID=UPI0021E86C22|nr:uncharacterized protein LOC127245296 isoform X2 [Andrographis paniculata]
MCNCSYGCINGSLGEMRLATTPPRGWNSYDSFCWTVSEEEFLQNAQLVSQRLRPLGYEYVVVDYLWYRKKVEGANVDSLGFDVIDEWGRVIPDPGRWPSSGKGKGFAKVAEEVHGLGLKFGIHVMRGISTQAYNANTPILDVATGKQYEENGRKWFAKDVGIKERPCPWMKNGFMSVDTELGAGRAFLRSLYQQYADWGVDFVKHDCVFGEDFQPDEITYVSSVLKTFDRAIVYSLSPGTSATPAMASNVSSAVNMYRITGDDWDKWEDVASHFDVSRDFAAAGKIGANGLRGLSWPDLDMLPLGQLTDPGSNEGPHRRCSLGLNEQRTQMTLWSIAKSPLMFGGDMRDLDDETFALITNPTLLEINSFSADNKEFPYISTRPLSDLKRFDNVIKQRLSSKSLTLGLTSCNNVEARGWSVKDIDDDLEQVCWKDSSKGNRDPFCFHKRTPLLSSSAEDTYQRKYNKKIHLVDTKMSDFCLGASPNRKLASREIERGSISPCRMDTNQMWELNNNGTLENSYSGLCAYMTDIQTAKATGTRAWIATGRKKGEIFVAFFNLDRNRAELRMQMSDLDKAIPGRKLNNGSCRCREVWSGKDYGNLGDTDTVSAEVESHGTALLLLQC